MPPFFLAGVDRLLPKTAYSFGIQKSVGALLAQSGSPLKCGVKSIFILEGKKWINISEFISILCEIFRFWKNTANGITHDWVVDFLWIFI